MRGEHPVAGLERRVGQPIAQRDQARVRRQILEREGVEGEEDGDGRELQQREESPTHAAGRCNGPARREGGYLALLVLCTRGMWWKWFVGVLSFVVFAAGSDAAAQSDPPADGGTNTEIARLVRSRDAVRYSVAMSGTPIRAGGAMLAVDAPLADVRRIVTDYAHYQDFLPGFQRSRILARGPSGTDVYLQAPILHGAATLWAVVRFGLPVHDGTGEKIEGIKTGPANLDDLRATWKLYPIDANRTLLKLEFLMIPSLPLPGAMITPQLEESSEDAIRACRDRAEAQARSRADGSRAAD